MTIERRSQLWAQLDAGGRDPAAVLRRVCELCLLECAVSGAAVTVQAAGTNGDGAAHAEALACSTGETSVLLDDVQRTVGEGPGISAFDTGGPILVGNLAGDGTRWPGFTEGALGAGVAAVFAFPLQLGAARLGILSLHRMSAGALSEPQLRDALLLAEIATQVVLDDLAGADPMDIGWLSDIHASVHQASGMVMVQLGVGLADALLRVRAHAYSHQLTVDQVAKQIVGGALTLQERD